MSTDEHRAPGRLAANRRGGSPLAPPHPMSTPRSVEATYQVPPVRPAAYDDYAASAYRNAAAEEAAGEPSPPAAPEPLYNGGPASYRYESASSLPAEAPAPRLPAEALHSPEMDDLPTGHLNKQQQLLLLLQTIQLYDDEWKLASIQPKAGNVMRAYLVPRNHPLDLKTAFSKRKYLVILINDRGNIEVKQPQKRGPLQTFLSWFYGG